MKQQIIIHVIDSEHLSETLDGKIFICRDNATFTTEFINYMLSSNQTKHYSLNEFQNEYNRSYIDSNATYILCEVKDVEEEIVQPEGLNYVTVPIVELASELAHNATVDECNNDGNDLFVEDSKDEVYTEIAQEVFNRWYDYYYNEIQNTTKKF